MTITNDQLKNVMLKPLMRKNPSQEERNDPTATSNKNDLIEELKMAKNLDGIKKAKESNRNLNEVKNRMAQVANQFTVEEFMKKISEKDVNGNEIPLWKRHMLAKKAAEKAKKEAEETIRREYEERKSRSIPAWKKKLLKLDEDPLDRGDGNASNGNSNVSQQPNQHHSQFHLLSQNNCRGYLRYSNDDVSSFPSEN
ncbi:hypothetical protein QR98_0054830 [Sarcoptes scabiei]|uniref:Uncharacterized protein n=1 Tax=Sarcoptes scabiei TaxID=52283 RepID=A0A132A7Q1_SARSC|nr:hypothetical protein QR98_0054830 [Sarcoptes scabiei]